MKILSITDPTDFSIPTTEKFKTKACSVLHSNVIPMKPIKHRKGVSFEQMSKFFEMPLKEAALRLKISLSLLKRLCREYGFKRWPYRRISCLQSKITNLELQKQDGSKKNILGIDEKIEKLKEELQMIKRNPQLLHDNNKVDKINKKSKNNISTKLDLSWIVNNMAPAESRTTQHIEYRMKMVSNSQLR